MKLKSILYLLIALPLLWSCNNEDNIEDIFSSGTWYLINFYGGGLDDAGTPEFTPKEDVYKRQVCCCKRPMTAL